MLVFIHINKTAGRTVRYMLRSTFGLRHCEVEPWESYSSQAIFSAEDLRRTRKLYPRLESIAGHRVRGNVDLQEYDAALRYFTIMRDPVKTCASRYQYNVQYRGKKDLIFEEWIEQEWTRNHQTKMIAGVADADAALQVIRDRNIFVGLTEHFDESMVLLQALVAPSLDISYQRVNVATSNTLAQELLGNPTTRRMLIEANCEDQKLYDYVRQELFPRYRQEYGPALDAHLLRYQHSQAQQFNRLNLTLSRLKQYLVYKPVIRLARRALAA